MKKIILPLAVLLSLSACAQSSHLDQYFSRYNTDGVQVELSSFMLTMQFSDKPSDKDGDWLKKVSYVRCWSIDSARNLSGEELAALDKSLKLDNFEEWFTARKGKSRLELVSRKEKSGQEDIVCVIAGENGSGLCFHIKGHFTAKDLAQMEHSFADKAQD